MSTMKLNNTKDRNLNEKFDMKAPPRKWAWYLKPIGWALSFPEIIKRKSKIRKHNVEGLKPPYLMLCTHAAFIDFKVAIKAMFPHPATFVVAIDGFIHREKLMRNVGCIATRKFIIDTQLVKNLVYSINKLKQNVVMYPEARYSIFGTTAIIPQSLGKLAKLLKVPVVILNTHGHYISSRVWNLTKEKNRIDADFTQIVNRDEINTLTPQEINDRIKTAFKYDEYQWLKERNYTIKVENRANGLEKVLYKCPHCKSEFVMSSEKDILTCQHCKKKYRYNEDGSITALDGQETEFSHIPDWAEWERECVREEIENGSYKIEDDIQIDSLPNSKGFIDMGTGHLVHSLNGLDVKFDNKEYISLLHKNVADNYSCHIEFDYNNKGDCVSFSQGDDTYYFYFKSLKNIVVKIHFAVEELYKHFFPSR